MEIVEYKPIKINKFTAFFAKSDISQGIPGSITINKYIEDVERERSRLFSHYIIITVRNFN